MSFTFTRHHDLVTAFRATPVYVHEPGRGGQVDSSIELHFEWEEVREVSSDGLLYMLALWTAAVWGSIAFGLVQWSRGSIGARLDDSRQPQHRTKGV